MDELQPQRPAILVAGDHMIDAYYRCEASRLTPEAPLPVLKVLSSYTMPGGAGNVANNVHHLLGGVDTFVTLYGEGSSSIKRRYLVDHHLAARVDNDYIAKPITPKVFTDTLESNPTIRVVLFSDYGKGALEEIEELINICIDKNIRCIVDPYATHWFEYRHATAIKCNDREYNASTWIGPHQAVIKTKGDAGIELIRNGEVTHYPTRPAQVVDVTGAGDTVLAALGVCLTRLDCTIEEAITFANRAAGVAVSKLGTYAVRKDEVPDA